MTTCSHSPTGGSSTADTDLTSTSCAQDSPASPSPSLASNSESTTSDGCGPRLPQPYGQYDRHTSSWRTSAHLSETLWPSEPSLVTFTPSGSMRNGQLYERPTLAHRPRVNGSSCWPTPRASMGSHGIAWGRAETGNHRSQLEDYVAWLWLRSGRPRISGLQLNPEWTDWLMGFPTNHTACVSQENAVVPAVTEHIGRLILADATWRMDGAA